MANEHKTIEKAIASENHLDIALSLSDAVISAIADNDGNENISSSLKEFRDMAWVKNATSEELGDFTQQLMSTLPDVKDRQALLGGITRLGQTYDIAALVARDNVLSPDGRNNADSNISSDLDGFKTAEDAVKWLNKPVFEVTMTAHPTNVIDIDSIKSMRKLSKALDTFRRKNSGKGSEQEVLAAIDEWVTKPIIPVRQAKGKDGNDIKGELEPAKLTVQKETKDILRYLRNAYDDLPLSYEAFDRSISEKDEGGKDYNPADLNLQMRFSSWGSSGDKDGNNNVTSETTLNAIALHKLAALGAYRDDLETMKKDGNLSSGLPKQLKIITEAYDAIETINDEIEQNLKGGESRFLPPKDFDRLTEELRKASKIFDASKLEDAAKTQFDKNKEEYGTDKDKNPDASKTQDSLNLLRRVRTFGSTFGHIEYRETAEEYTRVVGKIIDGYNQEEHIDTKPYADMSEEEKMSTMNGILMDKASYAADNGEQKTKAQMMLDKVRGRFENKGNGTDYASDKVSPIGYQTIHRIKLARDFPDMIMNNVLAESENASNLLEAVFLQAAGRASDDKHAEGGERAVMGVVPLFESPEVMQRVDKVMEAAYDCPAYKEHLDLVANKAKEHGIVDADSTKSTQQIQIAHSDNTRRAGIPAARAFIHDAHNKLRTLTHDKGLNVEFFEGGSNSDPLRGGLRSISAAVNQYKTHEFMKLTFQGGDLLNYFNHPGATERLFSRNLSHAAKVMQDVGVRAEEIYEADKHKDGQSKKDAFGFERTSLVAAQEMAQKEYYHEDHKRNELDYNGIAVEALKSTLPDYQKIFTKEVMGNFLTITKDDAGNVSSRAKSRTVAGVNADIVDPQNVRTITFSESFQHAGVVPTFFGVDNLNKYLYTALHGEQNGVAAQTKNFSHKNDYLPNPEKEVSAKTYQEFYQHSAVFRDVVDRMAFGLAKSDIEQVDKVYPELEGDVFLEDHIKPSYREAAKVVLAAMPEMINKNAANDDSFASKVGGASKKPINVDTASFDEIKEAVRERLPHMKEAIEHKSAFMGMVQNIKQIFNDETQNAAANDNSESLGGHAINMVQGLLHAANDTVTHGLFLNASDRELTQLQGWKQDFPEKGRERAA